MTTEECCRYRFIIRTKKYAVKQVTDETSCGRNLTSLVAVWINSPDGDSDEISRQSRGWTRLYVTFWTPPWFLDGRKLARKFVLPLSLWSASPKRTSRLGSTYFNDFGCGVQRFVSLFSTTTDFTRTTKLTVGSSSRLHFFATSASGLFSCQVSICDTSS